MSTRYLRRLSALALIALVLGTAPPTLAVQRETTPPPSVAGTWTMTVMSHEIGMQLTQDGKKVTGTLLMMGNEIPLKGEFVDDTLTLTSDAQLMARPAEGPEATHGPAPRSTKLEVKVRPSEDGTLAGEMPGPQGQPLTFTAERLKVRKVR